MKDIFGKYVQLHKLVLFCCDYCNKPKFQKLSNFNHCESNYCSGSCAKKDYWEKHREINDINLNKEIYCACGCSGKLNKYTLDSNSNYRERRFIKGHSINNSGRFVSGNIPKTKGKTLNEIYGIEKADEIREKSGEANKGKPAWNKGRESSLEERIRHSCLIRGIDINEWDGFAASDRAVSIRSSEYQQWRTAIFEHDDYICNICGIKGGKLQAHHIHPWKGFIELRYNIDNGVTLCKECHNYIHSNKYKGNLKVLKEIEL